MKEMKEIIRAQAVYFLLVFFLSVGIGYYVKKIAVSNVTVGGEDNRVITATSEYNFKEVEEKFKEIQEKAAAESGTGEAGEAPVEDASGGSCGE